MNSHTFAIIWLIFWPLCMGYLVFRREINKVVKKKYRKIQVKRNIHKVLVEPNADAETLAFALAASDIASEDLLTASHVHPAIKDRFSSRGKRRIATEAVLLRKDEHPELRWDDKWGNVIRDHNWELRRWVEVVVGEEQTTKDTSLTKFKKILNMISVSVMIRS